MNHLMEELKRLNEQYSLCYLKLVIKRSYGLEDKKWSPSEHQYIALETLDQHAIYNQAGVIGLGSDVECQLSTIDLKPYRDQTMDFVYEQVMVLRRPLGKLLEIKLPKAPLSNDDQFDDYDLGDFAYSGGKLEHESYWEELKLEGFVDWINVRKEYLMIEARKRGVVFECLQRNPVLHNIVDVNRNALCFDPKLMTYYCNEREWGEYAVISIWRYYLGLHRNPYEDKEKIIRKKEEWPLLWEKYKEIVEWLEKKHIWFRDEEVYEKSVCYVEKAKELVLKNPYLLDPMVLINKDSRFETCGLNMVEK